MLTKITEFNQPLEKPKLLMWKDTERDKQNFEKSGEEKKQPMNIFGQADEIPRQRNGFPARFEAAIQGRSP